MQEKMKLYGYSLACESELKIVLGAKVSVA